MLTTLAALATFERADHKITRIDELLPWRDAAVAAQLTYGHGARAA